jgi:hypothetical protein
MVRELSISRAFSPSRVKGDELAAVEFVPFDDLLALDPFADVAVDRPQTGHDFLAAIREARNSLRWSPAASGFAASPPVFAQNLRENVVGLELAAFSQTTMSRVVRG